MEIKTEVKTYRVEMQCPECKEGMMGTLFYDRSLYDLPYVEGFEHLCNKCNFTRFYDTSYPYQVDEIVKGI